MNRRRLDEHPLVVDGGTKTLRWRHLAELCRSAVAEAINGWLTQFAVCLSSPLAGLVPARATFTSAAVRRLGFVRRENGDDTYVWTGRHPPTFAPAPHSVISGAGEALTQLSDRRDVRTSSERKTLNLNRATVIVTERYLYRSRYM